jgi:hypothetical protein
MIQKNMAWKKRVTLSMLFVIFAVMSPIVLSQDTHAADLGQFKAGRIIDDAIFTNNQSMTLQQIQDFLNAKGVNCRAGQAPCIKDYQQGGRSAAHIIYDASQDYRINPQVLLVLAQKEAGLITANTPQNWQYTSATGYGCPDHNQGVCDSQYNGFTNQVNWAAKLFRGVLDNTWRTQYLVGQNTIYFNPDLSRCGSTQVTIENRSTVALYVYTPYQPNTAALNAGYGLGDNCSAYGNRNFFGFFYDWFGSPLSNSVFLRSLSSATVYLVSGDNKYPVGSGVTIDAAYPLGGVGFVSQSYLDSKTTQGGLGRVIRGSDGTVYYFDAGIKLPFNSCSQVADYGYTCGQSALLTDPQINSFVTGPNMTNLYKTTSSKLFYINTGTKSEVYDDQALVQAGKTGSYNVLGEAAIGNLAYNNPIVRNDTFINNRDNSNLYIQQNNDLLNVDSTTSREGMLSGVGIKSLDSQSIQKIDTGETTTGYVKSSTGNFILTPSGKKQITQPSGWPGTPSDVSNQVLSQIGGNGSVSPPYFTKSPTDGTVYLFYQNKKRPMTSMSDLQQLAASPIVLTVPTAYLNSVQGGTTVIRTGAMVKSTNSGTVYVVDGLDTKRALASFSPSQEIGLPQTVATIDQATLDGYTTPVDVLRSTINCGGQNYIAMSGKLYKQTLPATTYSTLDDLFCNGLTKVDEPPAFLLASNGTIFKNDSVGGTIQPIGSYQSYISLGGNIQNTLRVSAYAISLFDQGSLIH